MVQMTVQMIYFICTDHIRIRTGKTCNPHNLRLVAKNVTIRIILKNITGIIVI